MVGPTGVPVQSSPSHDVLGSVVVLVRSVVEGSTGSHESLQSSPSHSGSGGITSQSSPSHGSSVVGGQPEGSSVVGGQPVGSSVVGGQPVGSSVVFGGLVGGLSVQSSDTHSLGGPSSELGPPPPPPPPPPQPQQLMVISSTPALLLKPVHVTCWQILP